MASKRRQPGGMFIGRADLGVEHAMIGDVIAVRTARRSLEVRRRIAVRDPQVGQEGHDRLRIHEPEAGMELDAVGGLWCCSPAADLFHGRGQQLLAVGAVISRGLLLLACLDDG